MVNPSFVATHHTTLRREYPPQTARVISSDIYLFSIGLTALLFVDTGAIRSLSSQPLTTAFLTRMVLAQRVPSLFTAAQILRDAPLSVLHFFSPLGAGGAGATLRRVRAAYSRTRCLPHQKGGLPPQRGVSALPARTVPTTLFRVHRICLHCGQKWTQFILHENRTPCFVLALGIYRSKIGHCQGKMRREAGYTCPALGVTVAHKGANTAFFLSEVYGCHPPRRRATQALTRADTCFCVFGLRSSIQIDGHWWGILR